MGKCLDKQTLGRFARGELSGPQAAAAEAHLEKCRRCAEALAKLPLDSDLIEALRDLERSRKAIDSALSGLGEVEKRATTTLFGDGLD